jgi:cell division FtsZ-interacting protein ZapD
MSEQRVASDSQTEFDQLQKKLVPLWKSIERFNQDPQTIVVVPSMSIDAIDSGAVVQAYEERPSVCLASHRLGSSTANRDGKTAVRATLSVLPAIKSLLDE